MGGTASETAGATAALLGRPDTADTRATSSAGGGGLGGAGGLHSRVAGTLGAGSGGQMISRPGTEGSSWRRPPVAGLSIVMGDVVVMGSTLSKQPSRVRSVRAAARAAQRAASDLVVSMAEAEQGRLMGVEGSGEALPSLRQVLIAAGARRFLAAVERAVQRGHLRLRNCTLFAPVDDAFVAPEDPTLLPRATLPRSAGHLPGGDRGGEISNGPREGAIAREQGSALLPDGLMTPGDARVAGARSSDGGLRERPAEHLPARGSRGLAVGRSRGAGAGSSGAGVGGGVAMPKLGVSALKFHKLK